MLVIYLTAAAVAFALPCSGLVTRLDDEIDAGTRLKAPILVDLDDDPGDGLSRGTVVHPSSATGGDMPRGSLSSEATPASNRKGAAGQPLSLLTGFLRSVVPTFGNAVIHASEVALFLRDPIFKVIRPVGQLATAAETILVSSQAALFLLALRRRFKRE